MRISGIVVLIWLLIGVAAAAQRGELTHRSGSCSSVATVAVVIVAGPLNYVGVNPHVGCTTPRPSSAPAA
ncbi:MAG: hypothetical protein ACTHOG_03195 [Marmoricola sp.]